MEERREEWKQKLRDAGFLEGTIHTCHFYKELTEKTAFCLNLKFHENYTGIVYGIFSTAIFCNEEEKKWLYKWGCDDEDCNLRYYLEIKEKEDEKKAETAVSALYWKFRQADKEEVLQFVKQKRKEFLNVITGVLKPLGYKKKGNSWSKETKDKIVVYFWADKNPYCDLYYLMAGAYPLGMEDRVLLNGERIENVLEGKFDWENNATAKESYDWQLQSKERLVSMVETALKEYLLPVEEKGWEQLKEMELWFREDGKETEES